jgi:hypothetical protein
LLHLWKPWKISVHGLCYIYCPNQCLVLVAMKHFIISAIMVETWLYLLIWLCFLWCYRDISFNQLTTLPVGLFNSLPSLSSLWVFAFRLLKAIAGSPQWYLQWPQQCYHKHFQEPFAIETNFIWHSAKCLTFFTKSRLKKIQWTWNYWLHSFLTFCVQRCLHSWHIYIYIYMTYMIIIVAGMIIF